MLSLWFCKFFVFFSLLFLFKCAAAEDKLILCCTLVPTSKSTNEKADPSNFLMKISGFDLSVCLCIFTALEA